jgi:hypothetical protein
MPTVILNLSKDALLVLTAPLNLAGIVPSRAVLIFHPYQTVRIVVCIDMAESANVAPTDNRMKARIDTVMNMSFFGFKCIAPSLPENKWTLKIDSFLIRSHLC